jgi:CheY-like chemotaxis protein
VGADSRRGRILIVDDEAPIVSIMQRCLADAHDVTALTSAREAARRIAAGARYDLILCDVMMPVTTGMDLHAELLHSAPDQAARMVFMTGGACSAYAREFLDRVANPRLDKPFDLEDLVRLVDERIR